jgi:hypothetical protein
LGEGWLRGGACCTHPLIRLAALRRDTFSHKGRRAAVLAFV